MPRKISKRQLKNKLKIRDADRPLQEQLADLGVTFFPAPEELDEFWTQLRQIESIYASNLRLIRDKEVRGIIDNMISLIYDNLAPLPDDPSHGSN